MPSFPSGIGKDRPARARVPRAGLRSICAAIPSLVLLTFGAASAGTPGPGQSDANLVPNSRLHGSAGASASAGGSVTGTVPTLWRAFALADGAIETEVVPLPPNELFPGSPPTNAIRVTVTAFGTDQGFDHSNVLFPIVPGRAYSLDVYLRSGNSGGAPQGVSVGFPLFDATGAFDGRAPGSFSPTAGSEWAAFSGPAFVAQPGDAFGHVSLRLNSDGGENSVLIALPDVQGLPLGNATPNPGFDGVGGAFDGNVVGDIPDLWRAFAVGNGSLDIDIVPVAADALFPGSAPTQAVRMQVLNGDGGSEGFDHELFRAALQPGHRYHGEVWMRSGNSGGTPQGVSVALPIFDAGGFTGEQPGSFGVVVGAGWSLLAGPQFTAVPGEETNLAFRLSADGGDDILFIALPRLVAPPSPLIFDDGFETQ